MIQRPDRRAHERRIVEERVTVSGTDRHGLVVIQGTIVNTSPGGVRIAFTSEPTLDPALAPDVVVTRSTGDTRHLVMRVLAVEDHTIRASFVDPPAVDPVHHAMGVR
jgi:hypothetical protein